MPSNSLLSFLFLLTLSISIPAKASAGMIEGKVPPVITSKPEPERSRETPRVDVEVVIVLRAIFTKDGKVTSIKFRKASPKLTDKSLLKSLTKLCIEAAKQIKFIPAVKDNQPVSMYMQI